MAVFELDLRPDARTLRQFGWIGTVGFSLLAGLAWQEWMVFAFGLGAARPWVAGAGLGLAAWCAIASLAYPAANRPVYVGLAVVTFPIGFVLSYVILAVLFYGVVAPVGLGLRLFGSDPMQRGFDRARASYWSESRPPRPSDDYFKQF